MGFHRGAKTFWSCAWAKTYTLNRSFPMSQLPSSFNLPLSETDPEIAAVLTAELDRQRHTLEMIASENFVSRGILQTQGSVLTNKYAEGYPGKRYYGGCEAVDVAENLARDRAKALFGAEHANVQPHSGASANAAVLMALANPGDRILGLELAHGGHLTHGMRLNFSGKMYEAHAYELNPETFLIDMDIVRARAHEVKPAVLIAGWSAYTRHLDFAEFRKIADEVGAKLWVDMAHFAGMVATGLYPNPVPYADVVSTTVHKTLAGPRSGLILCKEEYAKKIDSAVFPGQQGGPLMHVIAGKAVAFKAAMTDEFKDRQKRTLEGAAIIAKRLMQADVVANGVQVLTGGTEVHMVLVDLRNAPINGQETEDLLHDVGITVNRNSVPNDPRPPMVTSGVRIGTPALATRGFGAEQFAEVAEIIAGVLVPNPDIEALRARTRKLTEAFPLYSGLENW
jgi:glycine hydroxymethyltransferase